MNTSQDQSDGGPRHVELVEVGVAERVDDAQVDVADGLHGAQLRLHERDSEFHEAVNHRDGICTYRRGGSEVQESGHSIVKTSCKEAEM